MRRGVAPLRLTLKCQDNGKIKRQNFYKETFRIIVCWGDNEHGWFFHLKNILSNVFLKISSKDFIVENLSSLAHLTRHTSLLVFVKHQASFSRGSFEEPFVCLGCSSPRSSHVLLNHFFYVAVQMSDLPW